MSDARTRLVVHKLSACDSRQVALSAFREFGSANQMAGPRRDLVRRGLGLQRLGNDLLELTGARSVHPVGLRVGGLHCVPRVAAAAWEGPHGVHWHRHGVEQRGQVGRARLIPPTSQSHARREESTRFPLRRFAPERSDAELQRRTERVMRSCDPGISCAALLPRTKRIRL